VYVPWSLSAQKIRGNVLQLERLRWRCEGCMHAKRACEIGMLSALDAHRPLHCVRTTYASQYREAIVADAEVVVTARKIEESPQDIPMGVQVSSGQVPGRIADHHGCTSCSSRFRVWSSTPSACSASACPCAGSRTRASAGLSVAPHLNGVYLGDANAAIARIIRRRTHRGAQRPAGNLVRPKRNEPAP
jgi:hypothetical protein